MARDLDDLRMRLEAIAEELGEVALDRLREAVAAGAEKAPVDEKRLTQARRAVVKAAHLVGQVEGQG